MRILLSILCAVLVSFSVNAQPVMIASSFGSLSVTADEVQVTNPISTYTLKRDLMAASPHDRYHVALDIQSIIKLYELEGNTLPVWPTLASDELLQVIAELEQAVDALISAKRNAEQLAEIYLDQATQLQSRNEFLFAENYELKLRVRDQGELVAELDALRAANAALAVQLEAVTESNKNAVATLARLLGRAKQ
jgi:hypothetical protein